MKAKTIRQILQGVDPDAEVMVTLATTKETTDSLYACINHTEGYMPLKDLRLRIGGIDITGDAGENMAVYIEGWTDK
jgi:hypothetical protein